MQLFKNETKINFISGRKIAAVLSALLIAASLWSLSTSGLNYGIDFTGGTKVELEYPSDAPIGEIRTSLQEAGLNDAVVQYFGSDRDILVRIPLS